MSRGTSETESDRMPLVCARTFVVWSSDSRQALRCVRWDVDEEVEFEVDVVVLPGKMDWRGIGAFIVCCAEEG